MQGKIDNVSLGVSGNNYVRDVYLTHKGDILPLFLKIKIHMKIHMKTRMEIHRRYIQIHRRYIRYIQIHEELKNQNKELQSC